MKLATKIFIVIGLLGIVATASAYIGAPNALDPFKPQLLTSRSSSDILDTLRGKTNAITLTAPAACPDVIAVAEREIGIKEWFAGTTTCPANGQSAPNGANRGDNICKDTGSQAIGSVSGYQAPFGTDGQPWCAAFVSWVFETAGYSLGSCASMCVDAMQNCLLLPSNGWTKEPTPQPGDIFVKQVHNTCGDSGESDHTGIVTSASGGGFLGVDGNGCQGGRCNMVQRRIFTSIPSNYLFLRPPCAKLFCENNQCIENGSSGISCSDPSQCVPHERTVCSADRTQCLVEVSIGRDECGAPPGSASLCQLPPPLPPPPPPGGGYSICENKKCVRVEGTGISQCSLDTDCVTHHNTCLGKQCIVVPEPGIDECFLGSNKLNPDLGLDGVCPAPTHKTCVNMGLGPFCSIVPGAGADSCKTDIDCNPPKSYCHWDPNGVPVLCAPNPGARVVPCNNVSDCPAL